MNKLNSALAYIVLPVVFFVAGLYTARAKPPVMVEVPFEKIVTKTIKTKCDKPKQAKCVPRTKTVKKCSVSVEQLKQDLWECKGENNVLATTLYTTRRMLKNDGVDPAEYPEDLQWFLENEDIPNETGKNPNGSWFSRFDEDDE